MASAPRSPGTGEAGAATPGPAISSQPTQHQHAHQQATPSQRRSAARTAVVWASLEEALRRRGPEGLRVLDVGGGTGDFAVRVAGLGAEVLVVDPSPDALAALDRRAREGEVSARVRGVQGDLDSLTTLVDGPVDVVLCHGVLDVVAEPTRAWETFAAILPPSGLLSVLVGQLHASVIARAMAGHLQQARELLEASSPTGPRRFTEADVRADATHAGFSVASVHAIRVFSDLVPDALLDLEPGAGESLLALEAAVAERAEYLPLAQQLHVLATRD